MVNPNLPPNMLTRLCLFWFSLSLASFSLANGEDFLGVPREEIDELVALGYNLDPQTEALVKGMAAKYPESPVSGIVEAGFLYWMQNYQEWDEDLMEAFEARAEKALEKAESYLDENEDDPDARFAVAMVELMQVIYYVDHHRWWSAFWKSRSSLKTMRRLVAEYPDYQDAKLPLGMHNCYMSRTPGYLKPLAFLMRFKGDWDLGIRYMQEARDYGLFCTVDAGYYLSDIWMELADDRLAARDEAARLVQRFPGNLRFRTKLAELERGLSRHEAARDLAFSVLEDERIDGFPAVKKQSLESLLWSSLGTQEFEITLDTALRVDELAEEYERLEDWAIWADVARGEAFLAQGKREEALALWRVVTEAGNIDAASAATRRLSEVEGES